MGEILRDITLAGDGGTVNTLAYDERGNKLIATGTTVPADAGSGYAKGCLFIETDTATANHALHQNTGTSTSCVFTALGDNTKAVQVSPASIATTGNTDCYVIAPTAGLLSEVFFSSIDALAAHDTNYITFTITNLGQAGAGSTVMLAATAANTTKATGGSALVANGKRTLTLAAAANLVVAAGDRLLIRSAASGTLAGAVTGGTFCAKFASNV